MCRLLRQTVANQQERTLATVDPNIYLSRADSPGFNEQCRELGDTLRKAAVGAKRITVVSAYYNTNAVINLFSEMTNADRKSCALRLVFSVEHATQLVGALERLRGLRTTLMQLGFRDPEVKLYRPEAGAPLHTKLYYFLRGTQPSWFIGSANLSGAIEGDRHEMMIRLAGSHAALPLYVNAVVDRAIAPGKNNDRLLADGMSRNLRSFFLSGFTCYSPRERLGMTFEACKLNPRHRQELRQRLEQGANIPYANAQAEGFGFSLLRALTNNTDTGDLGSDGSDKSSYKLMARFRHLAVETSLGFWLPGPYADIVRASVRRVEEGAETILCEMHRKLAKQDMPALKSALRQHIEAMRQLLPNDSDRIRPRAEVEELFQRFVDVRREQLADEAIRRRFARRLQITRLPDFWGDEEAVEDFEETFFSSLGLRLRKRGNVPHIAGVFRDRLGPAVTGTIALREALDTTLKETGWAPDEWPLPKQSETKSDIPIHF